MMDHFNDQLSRILADGLAIAHGGEVEVARLQAWLTRRAQCFELLAAAPGAVPDEHNQLVQLLSDLNVLDQTVLSRIQSRMQELQSELVAANKLRSFLAQPAQDHSARCFQRKA